MRQDAPGTAEGIQHIHEERRTRDQAQHADGQDAEPDDVVPRAGPLNVLLVDLAGQPGNDVLKEAQGTNEGAIDAAEKERHQEDNDESCRRECWEVEEFQERREELQIRRRGGRPRGKNTCKGEEHDGDQQAHCQGHSQPHVLQYGPAACLHVPRALSS